MPEAERPGDEPGHDLVADAEQQRRVEHLVRERHGGRERDHVAAEQRELHSGAALGDPVAHRRHATRELGDAAGAQDLLLQQRRIALERLVRGEHVVVGGDDRDVGDSARWASSPFSSDPQAATPCARFAQPASARGRPSALAARSRRSIRSRYARRDGRLRRAIRSVTSATVRWTSRDRRSRGEPDMRRDISTRTSVVKSQNNIFLCCSPPEQAVCDAPGARSPDEAQLPPRPRRPKPRSIIRAFSPSVPRAGRTPSWTAAS